MSHHEFFIHFISFLIIGFYASHVVILCRFKLLNQCFYIKNEFFKQGSMLIFRLKLRKDVRVYILYILTNFILVFRLKANYWVDNVNWRVFYEKFFIVKSVILNTPYMRTVFSVCSKSTDYILIFELPNQSFFFYYSKDILQQSYFTLDWRRRDKLDIYVILSKFLKLLFKYTFVVNFQEFLICIIYAHLL